MKFNTGEFVTGALVISAVSGFVVAYQYELATPFISSVAMEATIPFGPFWRSLHFWSSQAFFLLLFFHTCETISWPMVHKRPVHKRHWTVIALTVPMALFALFTGYVLRYDATGQAACMIAEHLLLKVPLLGHALNRFLIAASDEGLNRVYALHILLTFLLWGLGTWYHLKRITLKWPAFRNLLLVFCAFCALVEAPIDLPGQNVVLIKGPWFFLGVQELLRYWPPFIAGVLYPMIPIAALIGLPWLPRPRVGLWIIGMWGVSYGYLTLVASLR